MVKIYNAACQLMSTLELDNGGRGDKIDDPDELRLSGACKGKLAEGNDKPVHASCVCVYVSVCACMVVAAATRRGVKFTLNTLL